MIAITRDEADMLRKKHRGADVHMSNRQKNRKGKHYYLTESFKSMKILNEYRKKKIICSYDGR